MSMPKWMAKYPCPNCESGYGQCSQFATAGMKCCANCTHPDYATARPNPWTISELEEMWAGREMPAHVAAKIAELNTERDKP